MFLGTESSMYVSFDDGDHWQSLKLNSPNTSYRDMVIKDNDLVVGTYGRSFWILDDISPLRQVNASLGSAYLFAPGDAVRVRRNVSQDTPMPPEVPHALNAPPGALIYYYLGTKPSSEITIDITDSEGKLIRHYSSAPIEAPKPNQHPIPEFWKEVLKPLPTEPGTNRINWDLRYENPVSNTHDYDISATPGLTPLGPLGPLVLPGIYNVTLTVDGKKFAQKVTVKNDPRSPGSPRDLREQHLLQVALLEADSQAMAKSKDLAALKKAVSALEDQKLSKELSAEVTKFSDKLDSFNEIKDAKGNSTTIPSFNNLQGSTIGYLAKMEFGDIAPSQPIHDAVTTLVENLRTLTKIWTSLQEKDLKSLNEKLTKAGIPTLPVSGK